MGMKLENPLVGARRAVTVGRGASLRAARLAGAFVRAADFFAGLPVDAPGADRSAALVVCDGRLADLRPARFFAAGFFAACLPDDAPATPPEPAADAACP